MVRKLVWLSVLVALSSVNNARAEDPPTPGMLLDQAIKAAAEKARADVANTDAGQALQKVQALEKRVDGIDERLKKVEKAVSPSGSTAATTSPAAKKPSTSSATQAMVQALTGRSAPAVCTGPNCKNCKNCQQQAQIVDGGYYYEGSDGQLHPMNVNSRNNYGNSNRGYSQQNSGRGGWFRHR